MKVETRVEIERALLVGTTLPSSGTFKVYLAPKLGSAPSNSMLILCGGGGGGEPLVQETEMTVCGGPTTQVLVGPSTSAGG